MLYSTTCHATKTQTSPHCVLHAAGKCSALIKVTADLGDLVFGHSTWDSFTAMTRIYKHYQLQLQQVRPRFWCCRACKRCGLQVSC
jgi:hypothetical protein